MKFLINTATTFKGGSIQVARSFLEECREIENHKFYVILGTSLAKVIEKDSFPGNFCFYEIGFRPATRIFSLGSANRFLRDIEAKVNPDAVFTTSGPAYWRPSAPHLVGFNVPHCVYADSPYWSILPLRRKLQWRVKRMVLRFFFRHDADAYVVQTDDINQRLRTLLGTVKVYTVSNTCSSWYINPPPVRAAKLPPRSGKEFRFLTLSAWYPHKNLGVIPAVLDALPITVQKLVRFVLTLPKEDFIANFSDKSDCRIINIGPVSNEEGPALYRECDAMFLPTLMECFSASYVEAMAMARPILTSDLGFARTVCADAAHYFDPMNPADIAARIIELVSSKRISDELVEKGCARLETFGTARERAKQYIHLCEQLADGVQ